MATNAERRAAKIEFATRANQFTQTARALLEEWERCEMQTGETPAEVPYYPFHETLDEQVHEIIKWNENVSKWANDPDNLEAPCDVTTLEGVTLLERAHQYIRSSYHGSQFYGPVVKLDIPWEAYHAALKILEDAIVSLDPSKHDTYLGGVR